MVRLGSNPANSCPLTPLGFLERAATVFGDCPSVVYHDMVFTWSQTHRRCLHLASALVSLGINCGDTVSVLLPNVPAMYEMQFGVPMSGAVLNNINTRLDARTVAVLLRHSGSKLVFVDPSLLQLISDALKQLPQGHPAPRVIPVEDPHEKGLAAAPARSFTCSTCAGAGAGARNTVASQVLSASGVGSSWWIFMRAARRARHFRRTRQAPTQ